MTSKELKALKHIVKNGNDKNLKAASWNYSKVSLYKHGYLRRRVKDWAWIPTQKGIDYVK